MDIPFREHGSVLPKYMEVEMNPVQQFKYPVRDIDAAFFAEAQERMRGGFSRGHEIDDWLGAEAEINACATGR